MITCESIEVLLFLSRPGVNGPSCGYDDDGGTVNLSGENTMEIAVAGRASIEED